MEGEIISVGPWGLEEGTPFSHKSDGRLQKVVLIHEGGFKSINVKYSTSNTPECSNSNQLTKNQQQILVESPVDSNIIKNADFSEGLGYWRRNCDKCQAEVVSSPGGLGCLDNYVTVSRRGEFWHSIEQDITSEVYVGALYVISVYVSVKGGSDGEKFKMNATIKIDNFGSGLSFHHIGSLCVTNLQWKKMECSFSLNEVAKRVMFYLEGPRANVDLLIRPVSICPVPRKFVIKLQNPHEYLTGINGYSRSLQEGMPEVISSLTFMSNLFTYGPYGTEHGTFFSFKTTDGEVIGFHGTSDNYLKSIGFHVKPLGSLKPLVCKDRSLLVSSSNRSSFDMRKELMLPISNWPLDRGPWGGMNGKPFDDGFNDKITQILFTKTGNYLSSISIEYECEGLIWSSRHGNLGTDNIINRIKFGNPEEYLVQISGYWSFIDGNENNVAITSLTFFTNIEKYGPVGVGVGTFFSSPKAAVRIRGFFGRTGRYLTSIGVHMLYDHNAFSEADL